MKGTILVTSTALATSLFLATTAVAATPAAVLTPNISAGLTLGAAATALPLQGTVTFPGFGLPAGTYTDTVQVTLSW